MLRRDPLKVRDRTAGGTDPRLSLPLLPTLVTALLIGGGSLLCRESPAPNALAAPSPLGQILDAPAFDAAAFNTAAPLAVRPARAPAAQLFAEQYPLASAAEEPGSFAPASASPKHALPGRFLSGQPAQAAAAPGRIATGQRIAAAPGRRPCAGPRCPEATAHGRDSAALVPPVPPASGIDAQAGVSVSPSAEATLGPSQVAAATWSVVSVTAEIAADRVRQLSGRVLSRDAETPAVIDRRIRADAPDSRLPDLATPFAPMIEPSVRAFDGAASFLRARMVTVGGSVSGLVEQMR